jgi:N-acetylglucosaminyl-diphospho-decaprenol L-rhamnosyltransferase
MPKRTVTPTVSIIIVSYKIEKELENCLSSVFIAQKKDPQNLEVIVVDNDPSSTLQKRLAKNFPQVKYLHPGQNIGFGPANNFGEKRATGDFLFFLNPDTEIDQGTVKKLVQFLVENPQVGVVAPTLYDMSGKLYPDQGSMELTPLTAIMANSIVHRIWPGNPIANSYWARSRDLVKPLQLAVVPGTAMMIRRESFEQVGGFDERFFLYYEENDLCRRLREVGWEVWLIPTAKVRHVWHAATQDPTCKEIFRQSRYKYFQKYYGALVAFSLEIFLRTGRNVLISLAVLFVSLLFFPWT